MPGGAIDNISEQVARLVSKGDAELGFGFIVGLGIALWSANAGMKAIIDALNVVYEEKEKRGIIKLNLVSLVFTLGAVAALLLALGAVVRAPTSTGMAWFRHPVRDPGAICALAGSAHSRHRRRSP